MTTECSNHMAFMLGTKEIDFDNDSFKIILMDTGFTFDRDAHATYANVSASELATGNGYTQDTKTLSAAPTVTEDDANDRLSVTWDNVTWTAAGGSIGPTPGAIIYDDTTGDNTVVGYIDFGGDQTQADTGVATIANIEFRINTT